MPDPALLFAAWGDAHIDNVVACLASPWLAGMAATVITDPVTDVSGLDPDVRVLRRAMRLPGKTKKVEALSVSDIHDGPILFLDTDTRVIGDVSLGFDKARRHGIAMAPAPHYSLADFRSFGSVMTREGVTPRGQLVYNSGVIFFDPTVDGVTEVFGLAHQLALKDAESAPWGDQTYITLAMELLDFNPYTLSPSFNYRGLGELASGSIRIWHSRKPLPSDAAALEPGYLHRYQDGAMVRARKVPV